MNVKVCMFSALATDDVHIWYIVNEENLLMQVTIDTGEVTCLGEIPDTKDNPYSYRGITYHAGILYLVPYYAARLCKFSIEKQKFEFIDFPVDLQNIIENKCCALGSIVYNDELIIYGTSSVVIRYNMKSGKFIYYDVSSVDIGYEPEVWFWRDGFVINDILYLHIAHYAAIIAINLLNNRINIIRLNDKNEYIGYTVVKPYKNKICFEYSMRNGDVKIGIYEPDAGKLSMVTQFKLEEFSHNDDIPFVWGEIINDNFILIPGFRDESCVVELGTGKIVRKISDSVKGLSDSHANCLCRHNFFSGVTINKNKIASILPRGKKLVIFDAENMQESILNLVLTDEGKEYFESRYESYLSDGRIVHEQDSLFELKDFLNIFSKK